MSETEFDIAIVGGGMIGASLACAVAGEGRRVALLEASPPGTLPPVYDTRTLALALGTTRILDSLGAWRSLVAHATPIDRIRISQQRFPGATTLDSANERVPALGYVVRAAALGSALYARLDALDVAQLRPAQVTDVGRGRGNARLTAEIDGTLRTLDARLVVAVDGARSTLRTRVGIAAEHRDYGHSALVARVVPGISHANIAYERFTPHGPLALLPDGAGCALVWTLPPDEAERFSRLPDGAFLAALQIAFGDDLGTFRAVSERRYYPLHGIRVGGLVRHRVALAGNAAHTLHPIAGQGLNLGMRDVALLAYLAVDALRHGEDPGDSRLLARYAEERGADHRKAYLFTEGLLALFSGGVLPWRVARGAGLAAFDAVSPLKHLLALQTMGLSRRDTLLTGEMS